MIIKRNSKTYVDVAYWVLFGLLLFFAGFRYDVGIDWSAYMDIFSGLATSERIEPGNIFINKLLYLNNYIDGGYWLWIMAFLNLIFSFSSIKKNSPNILYSILLYVIYGFYFSSLNAVRQYVAVSFCLTTWSLIINKKYIQAFIVICIAMQFHYTALFFLITMMFNNKIYSKKTLKYILLLIMPFPFFSSKFLPFLMSFFERYQLYQETSLTEMSNSLSILRVLFPIIFLVIIYRNYDKLIVNKYYILFINQSILYCILSIVFPGIPLIIRVGWFFQPALLIVIPLISKIMSCKNRILFNLFTIIYGCAYVYITILSRPIAKIIPFNLNFRLLNIDLFFILTICSLGVIVYMNLIKIKLWKIKF